MQTTVLLLLGMEPHIPTLYHSKKFQVHLRNEKYLEKHYNYGIKRKTSKKSDDETMVDSNNKVLNDYSIDMII